MSKSKDEAYETPLTDQINSAQKEQKETFIERAEQLLTGDSARYTEQAFEESFFSEVIPWFKDLSLRDALQGCKHIDSPQPLWTFFTVPNFVFCLDCAAAIQLYRSLSNLKGAAGCDICEVKDELLWTFSSYQYFTIAGFICEVCSDKQSKTLGVAFED